ncbi:MAG: hypothetical protein ABIL09_09315 [Gemmatimonadota bacterium]
MRSIAIAGAWGYIGRKLTDAALELGLETSVYDPGPPPPDAPLDRVTRLTDEEAFFRLPADLFHLALHPEHRGRALDILLGRARTEPILVLNEKPRPTRSGPGTARPSSTPCPAPAPPCSSTSPSSSTP